MPRLRMFSLALIVMLLLAACGGNTAQEPAPAENPAEAGTPAGVAPGQPQLPTAPPDDAILNPFGEPTLDPDVDAPPELELTLQALGVAVIPTPDGTPVAPFGGITVAEGDLPPPGEAVYDTTPEAVPDSGGVFDRILLIRQGGLNDSSVQVEIYPDGRVIRNGTLTATLPQGDVLALNERLADLNLFDLRGNFLSARPPASTFVYSLNVSQGGRSTSITAETALIPAELSLFVDEILLIGENAPPR